MIVPPKPEIFAVATLVSVIAPFVVPAASPAILLNLKLPEIKLVNLVSLVQLIH